MKGKTRRIRQRNHVARHRNIKHRKPIEVHNLSLQNKRNGNEGKISFTFPTLATSKEAFSSTNQIPPSSSDPVCVKQIRNTLFLDLSYTFMDSRVLLTSIHQSIQDIQCTTTRITPTKSDSYRTKQW